MIENYTIGDILQDRNKNSFKIMDINNDFVLLQNTQNKLYTGCSTKELSNFFITQFADIQFNNVYKLSDYRK